MDTPTTLATTPGAVRSPNEDKPRIKFLCSFNGNILPRPQDGKLRYVGGETRIVSVPRDIGFEELMGRMKELFEGATVLKYQQPDEDLDALVSVVNDDDVMNMMEEYDKLGSGDGFTRLRIFLFSNSELDDPMHLLDGDGRDTERRYVDALNSLNDSPEYGKQQTTEFQGMAPVDDIQLTEQGFNQLNLDGSNLNQRDFETPLAPVTLQQLKIPHVGSLQRQQSLTQRYHEMEPPWSPAYYSPRHPGNDFPLSPSSSRYLSPYGEPVDRYLTPYGEPADKVFDRVPSEDFFRQPHINHHPQCDRPSHLPENAVWLPPATIPGEKAGFSGSVLHGSSTFEGNNACELCRSPFPRNQAPELPSFHQVANPCAECLPYKEACMPNTEAKFPHPLYVREQNDPRSLYNDTHPHERGWMLHHQSNTQAEEPRSHNPRGGRLNDHYILDGNGMDATLGPPVYPDVHHMPLPYVHHDERPHYIRHGPEFSNELFHDQPLATGSHFHTPHEERGVRYGNFPYAYGPENLYPASSHGHVPTNAFWRNFQSPRHGSPSNEATSSPQQEDGRNNLGFIRSTMDSPTIEVGLETQNPSVESTPKVENHHHKHSEPIQSTSALPKCSNPNDPARWFGPPNMADDKVLSLNTLKTETSQVKGTEPGRKMEEKDGCKRGESNGEANVENSTKLCVPGKAQNTNPMEPDKTVSSNCFSSGKVTGAQNSHEDNASASLEPVKKAAAEGAEVKVAAQEDTVATTENVAKVGEETVNDLDVVDAPGDQELDSDTETQSNSKIEPTKAEEEAIARGLQTIKNDDLEEVRELGSGTYGAVYHGKWKGSDVAIKRIKASCFSGKPSERERLIADFWKEALILGSLHHPNVVSFYGVVRDGPDGSLATVTEFMVNGSLKQFLKKKDRTIDRRKRLIIAMDAAFGMEYLHGKNIVHFDLKCENLLVNMRDPHRPICKIGDLGLSKVKQHTLVSGGVRGTLPWMAPELLSGKSHMVTEKIDVYSFGIVMWELLTGDEPYTNMHCASIIGGIVNDSLRPTIPTWCDPEWKSLMQSCWSSEPAQRPSFSEVSQKLRTMAAAINVK